MARDLRASDADREATAERLRAAALEGRLDSDELEARLAAAYGARWCSELERLTTDVTVPAPMRMAAAVRRPARVNGFAIASLALAILWIGWVGSALAIVFGHVALTQIRNSEGAQTGRGIAIGGLVIGYLAMSVFFLAVLVSLAAP